jgi:RsiW-degrading membrane proteinase PrsW (M82 family)
MLAGVLISLVAAVVPTLLHTFVFAWADRFEREPRRLLLIAFLWGAIPAVIASIFLEVALGIPVSATISEFGSNIIEGALIAPLVEEVCKGLALWVLYVWRRQEFDGVLDGLVYGALIGFGFSMTEDFFYYISSFNESGFAGLSVVIFLRAVLFGLNHGFYTGLTGIGFGLARNSNHPLWRRLWPMLGLCAAISVHALHNFGATIAEINTGGIFLSLLLALGSVGFLTLVILLAWQHERNAIRDELADEVGLTLSAEEYQNLIGRWRRPAAVARATKADRRQLLVELALHKLRLRKRGLDREPELDQAIAQIRSRLDGSELETLV